MATAVLDEIVEKASALNNEELQELIRRLGEIKLEVKSNGKKGYVSPNTVWIKENSHKYRGMHVAIKDGEFIASGRTIKEADQAAKAKGVENPLLHYIFPEDYVPWGGW